MMTKEQANEIANTTLDQLGGGDLLSLMIGAKHFMSHEDGSLTFKFKGNRKMNYIRITLDADDTYSMDFQKFSPSKGTAKRVFIVSMVTCEQMKRLFERETGLYLSM